MDINAVVVAVVGALVVLVGAVIFYGAKMLANVKNDIPRYLQSILERMPTFIQEAAKYAALLVERMDQNGQLAEIVAEYASKADAKLDYATDIAVEKVEDWLEELLLRLGIEGVVIDIPENTIKDYIQKYVWENPDLFPQRKREQEAETTRAHLAKEALLTTPVSKKVMPENYPANLYSNEDSK